MKASDNSYPKLILEETATDGSDHANPAADHRKLFLGEDGALHLKDSAGTVTAVGGAGGGDVATDSIWDAAGDLAVGSGANTATKLALGAAATVLRSTGAALAYALPAGHEFDYAEFTSNVNITATSEASGDTIVTGNPVTYDGATIVLVEFYAASVRPNAGTGNNIGLYLFDGASSIGRLGFADSQAANNANRPVYLGRRLTPSAAEHTYSIRAIVNTGTGVVGAGAGGSGNAMPGFIRITKV